VAELGAGGGYTTELLARAVGPTGVVYAQNSRFILERFAAKPWGERLAKPVMHNVVRVDRDFDNPLPPELATRGLASLRVNSVEEDIKHLIGHGRELVTTFGEDPVGGHFVQGAEKYFRHHLGVQFLAKHAGLLARFES